MKTRILLFVTLFCSCAHAQDAPDFIVGSTETKTLHSQTYNFNSLTVEKGGTLLIGERSGRWTVLWIKNDVTLSGKIVARRAKIGPRTVSVLTPDKKTISHSYSNESLGGSGGQGGNATAGAGGLPGGRGANGTHRYGGGGGSAAGVRIAGNASGLGGRGIDAIDWRGAPQPVHGPTKGGNGGKLSQFSNGGLLLIYSESTFDALGGEIDLRGENGVDGQSTSVGCQSFGGYTMGTSGAGGGSPGGEGGRLVVIAATFKNYPEKIQVEGGSKGKGGVVSCRHPNGATNGEDGEDGGAGFVEFFELDQWKKLK